MKGRKSGNCHYNSHDAQNLDIDVIAEEVETVSQMTNIELLNCKFGRGRLFSKPASFPE